MRNWLQSLPAKVSDQYFIGQKTNANDPSMIHKRHTTLSWFHIGLNPITVNRFLKIEPAHLSNPLFGYEWKVLYNLVQWKLLWGTGKSHNLNCIQSFPDEQLWNYTYIWFRACHEYKTRMFKDIKNRMQGFLCHRFIVKFNSTKSR